MGNSSNKKNDKIPSNNNLRDVGLSKNSNLSKDKCDLPDLPIKEEGFKSFFKIVKTVKE